MDNYYEELAKIEDLRDKLDNKDINEEQYKLGQEIVSIKGMVLEMKKEISDSWNEEDRIEEQEKLDSFRELVWKDLKKAYRSVGGKDMSVIDTMVSVIFD